MAAADVGEILGQMVVDMLADPELVSLLGEGTVSPVSGIYRAWPQGTHKKPMIIITFDNLNPQTQVSGVGVYRPTLTFDVIVQDPWDVGQIYDALESRWSIPLARKSSIISTNFKLDLLQFGDLIEVPGNLQEVDTGNLVRQFSIPATARVIKTS